MEVTTGRSGGLRQTYDECVLCFRCPLNAWDLALRGTDKTPAFMDLPLLDLGERWFGGTRAESQLTSWNSS